MPEPAARLRTIDGLRGIAARAVVFYHINVGAKLSYGDWTPAWVGCLLHQGFLGVDVFFVLRGFAPISLHLRAPALHPAGPAVLGRHRARDKSLLAVLRVAGATTSVTQLPSLAQVLAHIVIGVGDIVPVFWTLCYEVQFYIFLVGTLVLGRAIAYSGDRDRSVRRIVITSSGDRDR